MLSEHSLTELSDLVRRSLPDRLGFGQACVEGRPSPEDSGQNKAAPSTRAQEFAAGRLAAKAALQSIGGPADAEIGVDEDGLPIWPRGWRGSISHSKGLALAVVCCAHDHPALGLDLEHFGRLRATTAQAVCHPSELACIPHGHEQASATRLFSLKEALYKCQFPSLRLAPRFHDLAFKTVREPGSPLGSASISVLQGVLAEPAHAQFLQSLEFHFWETDRLVCALVFANVVHP